MGGHGGLNILPQKRWNVYNFDNREKVRKDEEAAAKEEQLKREQSRKRDTEFRIEQLRQARGLASASASASSSASASASASASSSASASRQSTAVTPEPTPEPKSKHINLFEGVRFLDPIEIVDKSKGELHDEKRKGFKRMKKEAEAPKVVLPEDEKYRLGYGVAGKGVKLPWYMEKRSNGDDKGVDDGGEGEAEAVAVAKSSRRKSVEELRAERLKREGREKERERALLQQKAPRGDAGWNDGGYSRRR